MDLSNVFGKCEMEMAASLIMDMIARDGEGVALCSCDFRNDESELRGYELLIGYGWLKFNMDGVGDSCQECFQVTEAFLKRVRNRDMSAHPALEDFS